MQLGNAFSPIHIYGAHVRIVAHDFFDTASDFPKFFRLRPHHPKSNGEGRVGSKYQLRRPNPRFRRQAIGGRLAQAQFEMIPCLRIRRQNHNLRKGGIRQLRVVGKEKPRRTRSDIGSHDFRFGLFRQPVFDLFRRRAGRLDAGPQWKLDLNQQFRPVRVWKKLLLHDSHPSARHQKRSQYNAGYRIFFPHAPGDKMPKPLVSRGGIDPAMAPLYGLISGRSFTPRYGVKTTATIHEAIKENPTIQKMFPAYSPAVERAKPTGKNPITVTSVPASIGPAVWLQA